MKNTKTLLTTVALIAMSISHQATASEYSDYLIQLELEATNFDPTALQKYKKEAFFETTEDKLEKKLVELQGFWGGYIEKKELVKTHQDINPTSYLASLANAELVTTGSKTLSLTDAKELRELENEIISLLNVLN